MSATAATARIWHSGGILKWPEIDPRGLKVRFFDVLFSVLFLHCFLCVWGRFGLHLGGGLGSQNRTFWASIGFYWLMTFACRSKSGRHCVCARACAPCACAFACAWVDLGVILGAKSGSRAPREAPRSSQEASKNGEVIMRKNIELWCMFE